MQPLPRQMPALLCLAALLASTTFGAPDPAPARWRALFVFGDSYSDTGAGYVDGDGPTAAGYLAKHLGLSFTHAAAEHGPHQSLNFAVSGATTGAGEGRRVKDSLLGRGIKTQVGDFLERVRSGRIVFDPDETLFFIAGGLNDRRLPTVETVANLEWIVTELQTAGARYFLVAVLPTRIPAFAEVGIRLNPALSSFPERMRERLPAAAIRTSHWGEFFDEVMQNPGAYGLTNTTEACAGRALFNEDTTPAGPPERYYYYHAGHPSTAVHAAVGMKLYREALEFAESLP